MFRAWKRFFRQLVTEDNVTKVAKLIVYKAKESWPDYEMLIDEEQVQCFAWIVTYIDENYVMLSDVRAVLDDEIIRLL